MSLEREYSSLAKANERFFAQCQEEVAKLIKAIEESPMEGVNSGGGKVTTATVSMSAIMQNGWILAPTYYIQSAQARAVRTVLQRADCAEKIFSKVRKIIEEKKAEGDHLNPNTIRVIMESPLGRIAMADSIAE